MKGLVGAQGLEPYRFRCCARKATAHCLWYREHVLAGGLVSYGVDLGWCFRRGDHLVGSGEQGSGGRLMARDFAVKDGRQPEDEVRKFNRQIAGLWTFERYQRGTGRPYEIGEAAAEASSGPRLGPRARGRFWSPMTSCSTTVRTCARSHWKSAGRRGRME